MIYVHPTSQKAIDRYIQNPPQSALFTGPQGIGFESVINALGTNPYVVHPEKGSIAVETIRSLYELTKGRSNKKQFVVIDDADTMSLTAQNAFLKLLEEPSPSTYFLLLSHNPSLLLSTVRSRVAETQLLPITIEQSNELLDNLGVKDKAKRQQLWFIAEGRPALLTNLVNDDELFQARANDVRNARTLLQGTTYEKLAVIQALKQRDAGMILLEDAARLLKRSTSDTNASSSVKRLDKILTSYDRIAANGNVRLWLTMAVL